MTRKEIILSILNGAPAGMTCGDLCKLIVKRQKLTGNVAHYLSGSVSSILNKLVKAGTLQYSTAKGPRGGYVYQMPVKKARAANKVNIAWKFWKGIILKKDGTINVTQLKKELADFSHIIEQVPAVYMHVTGGTLSKPGYNASTVNNMADEHYEKLYKDQFKDAITEMKEFKIISSKAAAAIAENLDKFI